MTPRELLGPTLEHVRDFERYSDGLLEAIRASDQFSALDRDAAGVVLFLRKFTPTAESK